jgi:hypothetical protein
MVPVRNLCRPQGLCLSRGEKAALSAAKYDLPEGDLGLKLRWVRKICWTRPASSQELRV